jgi:hypothetical protein
MAVDGLVVKEIQLVELVQALVLVAELIMAVAAVATEVLVGTPVVIWLEEQPMALAQALSLLDQVEELGTRKMVEVVAAR